jgi:hypothetical protein
VRRYRDAAQILASLPRRLGAGEDYIDASGKKHPLGLREGATENAAACQALLADLI